MSPKAITNLGFVILIVGIFPSMALVWWGHLMLVVGFILCVAGRMSADA